MTMLERVARAIDPDVWEIFDGDDAWRKVQHNHRRQASLRKARAAIEAMKTPTEAMLWAANDQMDFGPKAMFVAAINAALSEGKETETPVISRGKNVSKDDIKSRLRDTDYAGPMQHLRDWQEIDFLMSEAAAYIERLEAALEPFATEAAEISDGIPDDTRLMFENAPEIGVTDFSVGDLRRARTAHKGGENG